jgi:hypothetical protein
MHTDYGCALHDSSSGTPQVYMPELRLLHVKSAQAYMPMLLLLLQARARTARCLRA